MFRGPEFQASEMLIGVGGHKGGIGKTTTAVHLAAFFQERAPTLLVDGDAIRSATKWAQRSNGTGLPFKVVSHAQMAAHIRQYEHVIIDTEGNPNDDDIADLAGSCDLMVVPAVPESVATDGLTLTIEKLRRLPKAEWRVLLTMVPPPPRTEGKLLRAMLVENGIPTFAGEVPRLVAFEKAAAEGVTVGQVTDRNATRAWEAYAAIGREITDGA
jgi:chromosome partitioning protein